MTDLNCFWEIPNWKLPDVLAFVWDALKAIVPAWVAFVAYRVSEETKNATKAQKEIAANQYRISQYEIRSKHFHEFIGWINTNKDLETYKIGEGSRYKIILDNISNTFPQGDLVPNIIKNTEILIGYEEERDKTYDLISRGTENVSLPDNYFDILAEKISDTRSDIRGMLEQLISNCQRELKIPQSPY